MISEEIPQMDGGGDNILQEEKLVGKLKIMGNSNRFVRVEVRRRTPQIFKILRSL